MFEKVRLTNYEFDDHLTQKALRNENVRGLWEERYVLQLPPLKSLVQMPKGSFGFEYAAHVLQNKLSPPHLRLLNINDPNRFLQVLVKQTHDIWHVVTGYDTSVTGETALQSFYAAQMGDSESARKVAQGILEITEKNEYEVQKLMNMIASAYGRGKKCHYLLGVRWESYLEMSLDRVRAELGL